VRVLLDTHVVLWWLFDEPQLGPRVRAVIANEKNEIFVSAVTVAEIAIKRSLGKLHGPDGLVGALAEEGFVELPLLASHSTALEFLPFHHRDPFDRMLVAQARAESLTLASYDARVLHYDVESVSG
jgi:PIN domain nuclease of toxin-antitoxin system